MRPEIERARELRRNMSAPEVMLWARLKRLRGQGYHFRRQAPFRGYFLDFVCFARRLAVEVDGGQHADELRAEHDAVRDRILRRHGFVVLRFWASDVGRNIGWVMDRILETLEAAAPAHSGQSTQSEPGPHFPTRAASRPVPPQGGEGEGIAPGPNFPTLAASRPVPPQGGEGKAHRHRSDSPP